MASAQEQAMTIEQQAMHCMTVFARVIAEVLHDDLPRDLWQSQYALGAIAAGATAEQAVTHGVQVCQRIRDDEALRHQVYDNGMVYVGALTWLEQQSQQEEA